MNNETRIRFTATLNMRKPCRALFCFSYADAQDQQQGGED